MAETQKQPTTQQTASAVERHRGSQLAPSTGRESSPFSLMQRFMEDIDRLFGGLGTSVTRGAGALTQTEWVPRMDVFQRGEQLVVQADLAGLDEGDVRVTIDDGVLTVSGERKHEHAHEQGGVYQCERSYGTFQRSLALPDGVDPESIRADFANGLLEITIPMPKEGGASKGRTVPIGQKSPSGKADVH